ncbi:MAG: hypothetical protein AAB676_09770, partial [Verrucomicrobiota bacterium]
LKPTFRTKNYPLDFQKTHYLDEFTFRFNRRKSGSRGQLFYRLLEQAVQVDPQPDKSMVGGKDFLNSRTF